MFKQWESRYLTAWYGIMWFQWGLGFFVTLVRDEGDPPAVEVCVHVGQIGRAHV